MCELTPLEQAEYSALSQARRRRSRLAWKLTIIISWYCTQCNNFLEFEIIIPIFAALVVIMVMNILLLVRLWRAEHRQVPV